MHTEPFSNSAAIKSSKLTDSDIWSQSFCPRHSPIFSYLHVNHQLRPGIFHWCNHHLPNDVQRRRPAIFHLFNLLQIQGHPTDHSPPPAMYSLWVYLYSSETSDYHFSIATVEDPKPRTFISHAPFLDILPSLCLTSHYLLLISPISNVLFHSHTFSQPSFLVPLLVFQFSDLFDWLPMRPSPCFIMIPWSLNSTVVYSQTVMGPWQTNYPAWSILNRNSWSQPWQIC